MRNLFALPESAPPAGGEYFESILTGEHGLLVERILSFGHATPEGEWYDQDRDEWVAVLEGEAVIGYEDGSELVLGKGGHVFLPRHVKHRVSRTSESCLWIAVHGFLMPCG